jgi:hypothetical protein
MSEGIIAAQTSVGNIPARHSISGSKQRCGQYLSPEGWAMSQPLASYIARWAYKGVIAALGHRCSPLANYETDNAQTLLFAFLRMHAFHK